MPSIQSLHTRARTHGKLWRTVMAHNAGFLHSSRRVVLRSCQESCKMRGDLQTHIQTHTHNVIKWKTQMCPGNAVLLHLLVSGRVSPLPRLLSWRDAALPALRSCCFTGRLLWRESRPAVTTNNAEAPSSPRPPQPPSLPQYQCQCQHSLPPWQWQ